MGSTILQHRDFTIAGLHEDAVLLDNPDTSVDTENANQVYQITTKLLPKAKDYPDRYLAIGCIKPDLSHVLQEQRSVDMEIIRPDKNLVFALPGKMTEAPYVADEIVRLIFADHSSNLISLRPCDIYALK